MKAILSDYRQAPRKVRVVTDLVKGKQVDVALTQLKFLPKRAGEPVSKLIRSAIANAKDASRENLFVKDIRVDKGMVMKRFFPVSRGRAHPIKRRSSHVVVVLGAKLAPAVKKSTKKTKTTKE